MQIRKAERRKAKLRLDTTEGPLFLRVNIAPTYLLAVDLFDRVASIPAAAADGKTGAPAPAPTPSAGVSSGAGAGVRVDYVSNTAIHIHLTKAMAGAACARWGTSPITPRGST